MYRHSVPVEAGPWYRVDTASGSSTPVTVQQLDGATAVPNAFAGSGSTVRVNTPQGRAEFTSATATLYLKRLTYNGAVSGDTPLTSTGTDLTVPPARDPDAQPASASVSGAVTVDLSTTPIRVLTLTGNVTSFAFSNPINPRQEIEVHFVQDATGSRTLAGVNSAIKWAGGSAPTLTTTANRRDIFRFRYISGVYYELARSMNVG